MRGDYKRRLRTAKRGKNEARVKMKSEERRDGDVRKDGSIHLVASPTHKQQLINHKYKMSFAPVSTLESTLQYKTIALA